MTRSKWTPDPAYVEYHKQLSTRDLEVAVGILERDITVHQTGNCNPKRLVYLEGCHQAIKELYERRIQ